MKRDPYAEDAAPQPSEALHTVTLEEFASVKEDGAAPLLGEPGQILIPENGDVMIYGDGGAGKTTLAFDLAVHWAAGIDWLGITIPKPAATLIIENEGPRPLLRAKVQRKLTDWTPDQTGGRAQIIDKPWAGFTFADETHRAQLANAVKPGIDVVIVGPLVCAGMEAAGTMQEVRSFLLHLADVRHRAGRRVTFILIHHENRAGKVSGAWEGAADTLLHVTGLGHGKTRLHIQKARWASEHHARTLELNWTGNDSFAVAEKPVPSEDDLAETMLAVVADKPGIGWSRVAEAMPGVRSEKRRKVRDRLMAVGRLVNIGRVDGVDVWLIECPERKRTQLYLPDDPTIQHLRPDPDADGTQMEFPASGQG